MDNITVIYHKNCADGFAAAWAVCQRFPDAIFHAATYGDLPPPIKGRDVIIVDFCYKPAFLAEIGKIANSVLVIDHHKSASEEIVPINNAGLHCVRLDAVPEDKVFQVFSDCSKEDIDNTDRFSGFSDIVYAYFNMDKSGAGLAWDIFMAGYPVPPLINHIEDRDLWRFELPNTREIQAALFSYPYDFDVWDELMDTPVQQLVEEGKVIERKHFKDIEELVDVCQRRMTIGGHRVPVASLPYTMTSDAGHLMAEGEPFAACYWDTSEHRCFSLRSRDDGIDVSKIAQEYGGGGHEHAAGFRVPRSHELAKR